MLTNKARLHGKIEMTGRLGSFETTVVDDGTGWAVELHVGCDSATISLSLTPDGVDELIDKLGRMKAKVVALEALRYPKKPKKVVP